ncbi:MAG: tetratricopeptide repeat protein [Dissulfurimicrobium sp.]|uniref:tetratricopeptide repeat protein n=1 Tax=Dissulfurimicrobium TaxID=1769732 RepID=UPI001EDB1043|nr:tetratricopeptide repeat protein [Dissulfurimicrobium hydrothermale]UKL12858.1 tetratricopeptide repeat protein [Dissulfurimicrobium hydrothermale]
MSRLFDALKELETREGGGHETLHYLAERDDGERHAKRPVWVAPLLVVLFFVAVGLGFIVSINLWWRVGAAGKTAVTGLNNISHGKAANGTDNMAPSAQTQIRRIGRDKVAQSSAVQTVSPSMPSEDLKNKVSMPTAALYGFMATKAGDTACEPYVGQIDHSIQKDARNRVYVSKEEDAVPENGATGVSRQRLPVAHISQPENTTDLIQKSLIQQAEEYRLAGRMEDAVRLYRTIWRKTGDVDVANNLGAALLVLGRTKEAEQVLQEALKKAPADMDIRFNLNLAREKEGENGKVP